MPRDVDPSSAEDSRVAELRALEAARAALYRRDADDDSRRAYAELAGRFDERRVSDQALLGAPSTGGRGRRSRRAAIAVVAVTVTVVAAILLGLLVLPRSVAVRMTPMRVVGATDPTAEEAAVLSLFAGSFAAQNKLALRAVVDPPPALADGGVQQSAVRQLVGTGALVVPQGVRSGTVTVVVLCTTATAFRWRLTAIQRGRTEVLATASSATCLGTASYATVSVADEHRATLRFAGDDGGHALVALVVVPDEP